MFIHGAHVESSFYESSKTILKTQMPAENIDIYPAWRALEMEQKLNDISKKAARCVA